MHYQASNAAGTFLFVSSMSFPIHLPFPLYSHCGQLGSLTITSSLAIILILLAVERLDCWIFPGRRRPLRCSWFLLTGTRLPLSGLYSSEPLAHNFAA